MIHSGFGHQYLSLKHAKES